MGLDDSLLNTKDKDQTNDSSAADRAGALNEARRDGQGGQAAEEPQSLREAVLAEKRKQAETGEAGESGAEAALGKAAAPMRQGTSRLLKQAWLHIIDSWGLTLIWINIHVFLGTIFGNNFFCKLGAEWLDNNIQSAPLEAKKKLGDKGNIVEGIGLVGCDLGCLLLIIGIASLVAMIVGVIDNPLRALIAFLKGIFSDWEQWD